ncbi:SOS response-associated peptidase family protein [Thiolapillus sp.]
MPATGFYEWQQTPAGKQPHHIHRPDNSLFAFAARRNYSPRINTIT